MKPRGLCARLTVVRGFAVVVLGLVVAGCTPAGSPKAVTTSAVYQTVEQVPASVTGATLVRRTGLTGNPPPPTTVTIHVGAEIAHHIAALLNALPSEPGGSADAGGGADITISVSFDGDLRHLRYIAAGGFYDAVTVSAPSQALPTLSGAGDLDNYLEGLF